MNFENSKPSDPQKLLLNLSDKTNLKKRDKYVALSNLSIYYTWKSRTKPNKFRILVPTWNNIFKLSDRSHSFSGI